MFKNNDKTKYEYAHTDPCENINNNKSSGGFMDDFEVCTGPQEKDNDDKNKKPKENTFETDILEHSFTYLRETKVGLFDSLKEITTNIYYSYSINNKFDPFKCDKFYFFAYEIHPNIIPKSNVIKAQLANYYCGLIYFSYRNNFEPIQSPCGKIFTNDNTWGCMIRSCQMLLAKGIYERKKYKFFIEKIKEQKISEDIQDTSALNKYDPFDPKENNIIDLIEIRKKVITLFYDNSVQIEMILEDEDFDYFKEKIYDINKPPEELNFLRRFKPPYSIDNICYVTKNAGKNSSDLSIISAFIKINKQFFAEEDAFLYFNNEKIQKKVILKEFCMEMNTHFLRRGNAQFLGNYISLNNKYYCLKRGGIIFVSLRLGLSKVEDIYIHAVYDFFKSVRNNIGFVSGTNNKGYYFVGTCNGKLLFLDPHISQKAINPDKDGNETYYHKDIYLLNPTEMSSALTFAVVINEVYDILNFFEDIQTIKKINPYFIDFE